MGGEVKKQRGEQPAPEEDVPPPPPAAMARAPKELSLKERPPWPCGCIEYGMIGRQLAYWSVVKRDLLLLALSNRWREQSRSQTIRRSQADAGAMRPGATHGQRRKGGEVVINGCAEG
jgi:hypothetical protein